MVVCSGDKLGHEVISAPYEGLALELANHIVGPFLSDFAEACFQSGASLGAFYLEVLVVAPEPTFLLFHFQAHLCQSRNTVLQEGRGHDRVLDVLGVSGVVYGLADDVIVSSPSSAGNVEGDFAKESVRRVLVNHMLYDMLYMVEWLIKAQGRRGSLA